MADSPARVLILGNDQKHLANRASVLRHFWEIDTAPLDLGTTPSLDSDLVVVCSSIPEPERQAWVDRIREQAPTMLVVKINGYDSGPHANADATVDLVHGPGALVSTIYELLTERGLPSRSWPGDLPTSWVQ